MLSASQFWQYSTALYADNSVKQNCLALQEDFGLNVNVLLLCSYCNSRGEVYSEDSFQQLNLAIKASEDLLTQHRNIRKAAKEHHPQQYKLLLEEELEMERQQQSILLHQINSFAQTSKVADNFAAYLASKRLTNNAQVAALTSVFSTPVKMQETNT